MGKRDLKNFQVLVTPKSWGISDSRLISELEKSVGKVIFNKSSRPMSEEELIAVIPEVDGLIAGLEEINCRVIESASKLKVISRYGVGVDRVDLKTAAAHGIIVTNTPQANSASVAELTVGLILALIRKICELNEKTKSGQWVLMNAISLRNKTVGLVGYGAIGTEVAKRLVPFGCNILVYDPYVNENKHANLTVTFCEMGTLINQSDVISLHLPATEKTIGMVNASFLESMKKGAVLINTARGELLDQNAVYEMLASGHLGGLAMDVYLEEPPKPNFPLFKFNNVIATPHTSAHTDDSVNSMGWMAFNDCLAVLRGDTPEHPVKISE